MSELAQLVLPAIRWDAESGFDGARAALDAALALGVGGFIVYGGTKEAVADLTASLYARSGTPLLVAADLERGAGQQFDGATGLPPAAALGRLDDEDATRLAARVTAREAAALGVNWAFAPVCDVDVNPRNPIIGSRAFGADATLVARHAAAWISACQQEGVLACGKHFPGHGRTNADSHLAVPVVAAEEPELWDTDLLPFRDAIEGGVASIMTAHVAYPALDYTGAPATLSRRIITGLLRERLGFHGLVVTDALAMEGVLATGEATAALRALEAGCDVLLHPRDAASVVAAIERGVRTREVPVRALDGALERRLHWAERAARRGERPGADPPDLRHAHELCAQVIREVRGQVPSLGARLDVVIVDDDREVSSAPSRGPVLEILRRELDVRVLPSVDDLVPLRVEETSTVPVLLLLFGDPLAGKGRHGYSAAARAAVARAALITKDTGRLLVVVQFSHPRLADEIREAPNVVNAWGGEPAMQAAAGRWLIERR